MSDLIPVDGMSPAVRREQILALQDAMVNLPDEVKVELHVEHHFAPGLYARECHIPAGVVVVSKIHKTEHLATLISGTAEVVTDQERRTITGPYTFISPIGVKNVVLALTDVIWTTYHVTNETDLSKIEDEVIAPTYDDLALPTIDASLLEVSP